MQTHVPVYLTTGMTEEILLQISVNLNEQCTKQHRPKARGESPADKGIYEAKDNGR